MICNSDKRKGGFKLIKALTPYLVTNGNGQEVLSFYEQALGAEIHNLQTFGDLPDNPENPMPEANKKLVLNALVKAGEAEFMLSDNQPGHPFHLGNHITLAIQSDDAEETRRLFDRLKESGKIIMPLQETPWSSLYGQLIDQYGVYWQLNTLSHHMD